MHHQDWRSILACTMLCHYIDLERCRQRKIGCASFAILRNCASIIAAGHDIGEKLHGQPNKRSDKNESD